MDLLDLCHEDILFPKILPLLTYKDWLTLRIVSRRFKAMMEEFFQRNRVLKKPIIGENIFKIFTQNAKNLRYLNLRNSISLTDSQLRDVLLNNRKLRFLDLTNCTGLSQGILQVVTVNCLELQCLLLGGCGWLKPNALEYHVNYHHRVKRNNAKNEVPLDPLDVMGKIGLRSKVSERKKSRYAGKDDLYSQLNNPCKVKKIYKKYLSKKPVIRQGTLLELDLSKNFELADHVFSQFFSFFNKIVVLNLGKIPRLTDLTMKEIAANLRDLQSLDISDNPRISDSGLYTVAKYCTRLRKVKATDCVGITENSIAALQNKNIRVQFGSSPVHTLVQPVVKFFPALPPYVLGNLALQSSSVNSGSVGLVPVPGPAPGPGEPGPGPQAYIPEIQGPSALPRGPEDATYNRRRFDYTPHQLTMMD